MKLIRVTVNIKEFVPDDLDYEFDKAVEEIHAWFVRLCVACDVSMQGTPTEATYSVWANFEVSEAKLNAVCSLIDDTTFGQAEILTEANT